MKNIFIALSIAGCIVFLSSCVTTHPNEKLLIGEWKPVKVEKYFTPEEEAQLQKAQSQAAGVRPVPGGEKPAGTNANTPQANPVPAVSADPGRGGERSGGKNPEDELNKLIQVESRSNMKIYPDKTVEKFYRNKTIDATWKLKGQGTLLVLNVPEKGEKYRIDILQIEESNMVVVGNLPIGGIKITYEKVGDAVKEETK